MLDYSAQLNPKQFEAVEHFGGPLLVLAGAGSGKTRVITYKIAHLVQNCGLQPWQICAVTFTNKAASEMRERVEEILGGLGHEVSVGTFHSTCLRILRRHAELVQRDRDFVIYDEDDQERLIGRILKDMNVGKEMIKPRSVVYYIAAQKHQMRGPDHTALPADNYLDKICARVYEAYEKAKRQANAFDFGDLIYYTVRLFEKHEPILNEYRYRWRYILVDEFQDTDHAQWRLLKLLVGDEANICVVGDDDQSIYRWRGAEIANILGFPNAFPELDVTTVCLEQNYRSTGNILAAATALIANNQERHAKVLWTDHDKGEKLQLYEADTEVGEAKWVVRQVLELYRNGHPLRDIVVFYRTHAQSRVFEDQLRHSSTPYVVVGGLKFYARKEVKDILAYLRLVQNPRDDVALMRVINVPTRGIGATTVDRARQLALQRDVSLFDGLLLLAKEPSGKRARRSIERFGALIKTLRDVSKNENDVFRVAEAVLAETGYILRLQEDGSMEAQSRKENIEELMLSIEQWRANATNRSLSSFLDHVSLLSSLDEADAVRDAITLMTVHAAKGLEFESVFVTGLEENVFPHFNAREDEDIEEERRLMYVAVTRGKKRVSLSFARSRQRFGRLDVNSASRFLREIPKELCDGLSENPHRRSAVNHSRPPSSGSQMGLWTGSRTYRDKKTSRDYDYSDSQLAPDEQGVSGMMGSRVVHPSFGEGQIARVDGEGPTAKVTVQFPGFGTKVIVARFLDFVSS